MFDDAPTTSDPSAMVQSPVNSKDGGYFQCGFCKRHYNRADHLIRHVRSHTREKPYVCDVCDKGFARPDLLKRHATGHSHDRDRKRKRASSLSKQGRVSQACKACASSKLKCDEEKPCRRCQERQLHCDWQEIIPGSSPEPPKHSAEGAAATTDAVASLPFPALPSHAMALASSVPYPPIPSPVTENPFKRRSSTVRLTPQASIPESSGYSPDMQLNHAHGPMEYGVSPTDQESGIFSVDGTFFPNFIPDSLITSLGRYTDPFDPSTFIPDFTHYGAMEIPALDFNLTDGDFGLIDMYNSCSFLPGVSEMDSQDQFDVDSGIGIGAEAFNRSSLSQWKPAHEDHAFNDHENLSVPHTIDSPDAPVTSNRQVLGDRLSTTSRDLIFGLVLETSREAHLSRIMKSFPSTELLDGLIQQFFDFQAHSVGSFIHAPTFQPNSEHASILAAVAAAAAVRSPIPTLRKLGYALMEIVRFYLAMKFENDNSTTRDLRASQIFALNLDIGMWSGNRRKTEIAESFLQPLVTMLRRALRFRRSLYPNVTLCDDDTGDELDRKWRTWVEQESFKRLVHHLFLHDAQSSLTLNINPLISFADLELPLPAARPLWEAKTAAEWKDLFRVITPERIPSLADLLQDMSRLAQFQDRIDTPLSALALLHGLSALINEYHRAKFISTNNSKHWGALVTNSRQQELGQALQHFRMTSSGLNTQSRAEISLVCEVVSMLLHMSLEELQLFAGKEDKHEARRVYHSALAWIASPDSRQAVWHAGQTLRAARGIAPGLLTGFMATSVYYAGLALWSYAVVSRANNARLSGSPESSVASHAGPIVLLDAEDSSDVTKFITLNCGIPAIEGPGGPIALTDIAGTMQMVQRVLRPDPSERTLPLVQSLAILIGDLGQCVPIGGS
ncbi:Early growth response protein 1 [Penicillium ucsense]|uniref:Early growth response protein 1 n=1 Tax=Penicillium ucsense TaxID=2839758 RepID=A0A8J8WFX1_9EURO|nr:Early growth response protein 1 [Penicillium ucsense]KAF7729284.1 Early growth response protein 1 [Penicillium ucsense]